MTQLNEKVFIITGSGDGIGRSTAQVAAQKGAHIIVNDLNPDAAEDTAKLIQNDGGKADHFQLDVTDRDAVFELAKRVETDFGSADLILNNAGVSMRVSVEKMTLEEMEWMMGINFYGVLNGTQAFLSQIKESNGHIINVSSILGLIGMSTQSAYNAAKFAVAGFSEALRIEMLEHDVRVSTVFPGGVRTKIASRTRLPQDEDTEEARSKMQKGFNQMAFTTPMDAGKMIVKGIEKESPRILIGRDALHIDIMRRLFPARYVKYLGLTRDLTT